MNGFVVHARQTQLLASPGQSAAPPWDHRDTTRTTCANPMKLTPKNANRPRFWCVGLLVQPECQTECDFPYSVEWNTLWWKTIRELSPETIIDTQGCTRSREANPERW